jgi:hypothetical protein
MRRIPPDVMDLLGRAAIVSLRHDIDFRFEFMQGSPKMKYEVKGECSTSGECKGTVSVGYEK